MEVGSTVVYGTTSGRSPVMKEGIIEKITPYEHHYTNWGPQGGPHTPATVTRYQVGIRRFLETSRWKDYTSPTGTGVRLSFPTFENITVVPVRFDTEAQS